jgi:hypothetical protein
MMWSSVLAHLVCLVHELAKNDYWSHPWVLQILIGLQLTRIFIGTVFGAFCSISNGLHPYKVHETSSQGVQQQQTSISVLTWHQVIKQKSSVLCCWCMHLNDPLGMQRRVVIDRLALRYKTANFWENCKSTTVCEPRLCVTTLTTGPLILFCNISTTAPVWVVIAVVQCGNNWTCKVT